MMQGPPCLRPLPLDLLREESKENKLGEWANVDIEGFFNGAGLCKKRCSVVTYFENLNF